MGSALDNQCLNGGGAGYLRTMWTVVVSVAVVLAFVFASELVRNHCSRMVRQPYRPASPPRPGAARPVAEPAGAVASRG
ncbi:MAG: hypothetical protein QOG22_2991 [Pseudonocardiales bacterium]|nr:hypothetical protein [Pseudonocardiales bacterium]